MGIGDEYRDVIEILKETGTKRRKINNGEVGEFLLELNPNGCGGKKGRKQKKKVLEEAS